MFSSSPLVLSLPAAELARLRLGGSFFSLAELGEDISPELALALHVVAAEAARLGVPLRLVARPEIFTSGESLAWLQRETGGATDHLCISDGAAVRVLPGLRTHAFFYRAGTRSGTEALRKLTSRAPELISGLASQVNTAFSFADRSHPSNAWSSPPAVVLRPGADYTPPAPGFLPLFFSPKPLPDTVARLTETPVMAEEALAGVTALRAIAVTGYGWAQKALAAALARVILAAYLNPEEGIILLLPPAEPDAAPEDRLEARVTSLLQTLLSTHVRWPRAQPPNILLATSLPAPAFWETLPVRPELLIDSAFAAWQQPAGYYDAFETITLLRDPAALDEGRQARRLVAELIGRPPEIRMVKPATLLAVR